MDCLNTINHRIEELQAALNDARARTRVFIPSFTDCAKAYRAIEDLELQIKTLKSLRATLELKRRLT